MNWDLISSPDGAARLLGLAFILLAVLLTGIVSYHRGRRRGWGRGWDVGYQVGRQDERRDWQQGQQFQSRRVRR